MQKTFATDTFPSRKVHNKGEKAHYYIQNSHPAIISRETFEQAQRLCDSRRAEHGEAKEYPLSRKLICGECGATFKRRASQSGYVSWVCRRRDRSKDACTVGRVAEESIYAAFMELCRTLKAHGESILQPAIHQLQALQNALLRGSPEMSALHTEMAKLTEQGELLSRLRSKDLLDTEAYMARSNTVNARLRELRAKRRALLQAEDDEGPERLRELWDTLNQTEITDTFDSVLFESMVENIVVESQERIRIRLKCGLELTEPVHGKGR